ncbi:MAG: DUF1778 domain-containing protein [Eggerthellaceae bacterium]|nr:DUF1778 domain-containing protein [Eggerthellaceae bacterium]
MATAALGKTSNSRMEFRVEDARKSRYEEAASMKGQTLTQWVLANLDDAANRAFDEVRITKLAQADFERFCEQLDRAMPDAAKRLLESDPEWA